MASLRSLSTATLLAKIAATRFLLSAARLELLLKANFNPNQPRVPRGSADGGQWTGGSGGGTPSSRATGPRGSSFRSPSIGGSHRIVDRGTHVHLGHDGPAIPKQQPSSIRQANRIGVETAKWMARAVMRGTPVGRLLDVVDLALWLRGHKADIMAFLDPPRSLDELRDRVQEPREGYEVHHPVEQAAARRDGFPEELIRSYQNETLVPRYRHWQVTGWFMSHNEDFGLRSPREILRGLSWEERLDMGLQAMIKMKILKP